MFFQRTVRQLYGVIVACFYNDPRPVSIEGFAQANAIRDAPVSNLFQVLFSSIDQSPLIPAIRSQKLGVAGDQLPLVT